MGNSREVSKEESPRCGDVVQGTERRRQERTVHICFCDSLIHDFGLYSRDRVSRAGSGQLGLSRALR
jgi:hypothetical protein